MLTYFLPDYNTYKIRTKQLPSGSAYMRVDVQNMLTNDEYSLLANPGQWSYDQCESIVDISFNLNIPLNVNEGDQYRMFLTPGITSSTQPFTYGEPVWHGSLQVFLSQSVDKPAYVNQIPLDDRALSMDTSNEFIYWEQAAPVSPTTTTTTLAPTTTTLAPTTTTTTAAGPTTTTTAMPQMITIYLSAGGTIPDDVRVWYSVNTTSSFNDLGLRTPAIYPNYLNAQVLNIAPTEDVYVGITTSGNTDILFGTGSGSGQFLSNCGLLTAAKIPASSWSGSTSIYINVETQGGQYAPCAPTTTTTTIAPTTTTTAAPGAPDVVFTFGNQIGGQGFDVCWSASNSLGTGVGISHDNYTLFMSSDSGCTTPYGTSWQQSTGVGTFVASGGGSGTIACNSGGSISPGNYYRTRITGSFQFDVPGLSIPFSPIQTYDLTGGAYQDLTFMGVTVRIQGPNCTLNDSTSC